MLEQLNAEFAIADVLMFEKHSSGLIQGKISSTTCTGTFFLLGGHVAEYALQPSRPILFMSEAANFEVGKAIRGGVPVCFPWFGPHKTDSNQPAHGLVRTEEWKVKAASFDGETVAVELGYELPNSTLNYKLQFGRSLQLEMTVTNRAAASSFELALHTYFAVSNSAEVEIQGLESQNYLDQLTGKTISATGQSIQFREETDRIYHGSVEAIRLIDDSWNRQIVVRPTNSESTVIWNPWIDKSKRMPDFGDLEYPHMCCIETANITPNQINLDTGQEHTTSLQIEELNL